MQKKLSKDVLRCPVCAGKLSSRATCSSDYFFVECKNSIDFLDGRGAKKSKQCKYHHFLKDS